MHNSLIFGFDLQPDAVGYSVCEENSDLSNFKLLHSGVYKYESGWVPKTGGTKCKQRRAIRQRRTQLRRKKQRLHFLRKELSKIFKIDLADIVSLSQSSHPIVFRQQARHKQVSLVKLAVALVHIARHRGFEVSTQTEQSDDDGKMFNGSSFVKTTPISSTLSSAGESVPDYFFELFQKQKGYRNRYTLRKWFRDEFDQIWKLQSQFYPDFLTREMKMHIGGLIFSQRPLKSQKHLIGKCSLEPNSHRVQICNPIFEYFRTIQNINQVEISYFDASFQKRRLSVDEAGKVFQFLLTHSEINDKQLLRLLGFKDGTCNLEKIVGMKFLGMLIKLQIIRDLPISNINSHAMLAALNIWEILIGNPQTWWRKKYALKNFLHLSTEEIDEFSEISIPATYSRLSLKAIRRLLRFMTPDVETNSLGSMFHDACVLAGYEYAQSSHTNFPVLSRNDGTLDRQELVKQISAEITNKAVLRSINQFIKVYNDLVSRFGKPSFIRIELARELKESKVRRDKRIYQMKKNEKRRNVIREELEKMNIPTTNKNILKYILWEEQNGQCPYSGEEIDIRQAFDTSVVEIDHIIPRSISFDESRSNKMLCLLTYNRAKNNRSVMDEFGADEFKKIRKRVEKFKFESSGEKRRKLKNLDQTDIRDVDEFISRQLNDTSYISSYLTGMLKYQFPDIQTQTTNGSVTHLIYSSLFDEPSDVLKDRSWFLHHAVDATIVAITSPFVFKILSNIRHAQRIKQTAVPYVVTMREFLKDSIVWIKKNAIVVHQANHNANGALHAETILKVVGKDEKTGSYLVPGKNGKISKFDSKTTREIRSGQFYQLGENYKMLVYETSPTSLSEIPKQKCQIISRYDKALSRKDGRDPIILEDGKRFLYALAIGDMFVMNKSIDDFDFASPIVSSELKDHLYLVRKFSKNVIAFTKHDEALKIKTKKKNDEPDDVSDDQCEESDESNLIQKSASLIQGFKIVFSPTGLRVS